MKKHLYTLTMGCLLLHACTDPKQVSSIQDLHCDILVDNIPISENSTVLKDTFTIRGYLVHNTLIAANWSFTNKAYAYSPAEPSIKVLEKITDIKVFTVNDYNSHYAAGTDISDSCLFKANTYSDYDYSYNPTKYESKASFLKRTSDVPDDFSTSSINSFKVKPLTYATSGTQQQLVVMLVTSRNTMVRDTTISFHIQ